MRRQDEVKPRAYIVAWVIGFWIATLTEGFAGLLTWFFASVLAYCLYEIIIEGSPWFKSSR